MKNFYSVVTLMFSLSLSSLATNYVVSGTGTNDDGTYTPSGICNGKPSYSMTSGSTTYTIIFDGNQWSIGQSFGSCNNSGDYVQQIATGMDAVFAPPATGWTTMFGGS